jgi:hypothetical protein
MSVFKKMFVLALMLVTSISSAKQLLSYAKNASHTHEAAPHEGGGTAG